MTTDKEDTIREIIANAKPVQDPLKELVQKTESDPGAPFEPENIELIAELRQNDLADYFRLRDMLKKRGVSVRALERAISGPRCVGLGAFGQGGAGTTADQTELLLRLAEEAELFHTPDRRPYADIQIKGGRKTLEIVDRGGLGDWPRERWFQETEGGVPCPESLKAALRTIAARAQYKGAQHEVTFVSPRMRVPITWIWLTTMATWFKSTSRSGKLSGVHQCDSSGLLACCPCRCRSMADRWRRTFSRS
jgi:hypothetical protein